MGLSNLKKLAGTQTTRQPSTEVSGYSIGSLMAQGMTQDEAEQFMRSLQYPAGGRPSALSGISPPAALPKPVSPNFGDYYFQQPSMAFESPIERDPTRRYDPERVYGESQASLEKLRALDRRTFLGWGASTVASAPIIPFAIGETALDVVRSNVPQITSVDERGMPKVGLPPLWNRPPDYEPPGYLKYSMMNPPAKKAIAERATGYLPTFIDKPLVDTLKKHKVIGQDFNIKTFADNWEESPYDTLLDLAIVADIGLRIPTLAAGYAGKLGRVAEVGAQLKKLTPSFPGAVDDFNMLVWRGLSPEEAVAEITKPGRYAPEVEAAAKTALETTKGSKASRLYKFGTQERPPFQEIVEGNVAQEIPRQWNQNVATRGLQYLTTEMRAKSPVLDKFFTNAEVRLGIHPTLRFVDAKMKFIPAQIWRRVEGTHYKPFKDALRKLSAEERADFVNYIELTHVDEAGNLSAGPYVKMVRPEMKTAYDAYSAMVQEVNYIAAELGLKIGDTLAEYTTRARMRFIGEQIKAGKTFEDAKAAWNKLEEEGMMAKRVEEARPFTGQEPGPGEPIEPVKPQETPPAPEIGAIEAEPTRMVAPTPVEAPAEYNQFLEKTKKTSELEEFATGILDELAIKQVSPRGIGKKFWEEIYPTLTKEQRAVFNDMVMKQSGFKPPGNGLKDWQKFGIGWSEELGDTIAGLEGTERGYVALMASKMSETRTRLPLKEGLVEARPTPVEGLRDVYPEFELMKTVEAVATPERIIPPPVARYKKGDKVIVPEAPQLGILEIAENPWELRAGAMQIKTLIEVRNEAGKIIKVGKKAIRPYEAPAAAEAAKPPTPPAAGAGKVFEGETLIHYTKSKDLGGKLPIGEGAFGGNTIYVAKVSRLDDAVWSLRGGNAVEIKIKPGAKVFTANSFDDLNKLAREAGFENWRDAERILNSLDDKASAAAKRKILDTGYDVVDVNFIGDEYTPNQVAIINPDVAELPPTPPAAGKPKLVPGVERVISEDLIQWDAIQKEIASIKKNPEYAKDTREGSVLRNQLIDLERESEQYRPAAIARAEKEIAKPPITKKTIKEPEPAFKYGPSADPYKLASHYKAQGVDRQTSWSYYVRDTSLNPRMDAKDWYKIYDDAAPELLPELGKGGEVPVKAAPTAKAPTKVGKEILERAERKKATQYARSAVSLLRDMEYTVADLPGHGPLFDSLVDISQDLLRKGVKPSRIPAEAARIFDERFAERGFEAAKGAGKGPGLSPAEKAAGLNVTATHQVTHNGHPVSVYEGVIPTKDLGIDPKRFQFKLKTDPITGRNLSLQGVTTWDPTAVEHIWAWEDIKGKFWVTDGHQRTGLAKDLNIPELPSYWTREADGITWKEARSIAAIKNLLKKTGTAEDAAKFMRDTGKDLKALQAEGVSPNSEIMYFANDLAKLSDDVFYKVVNEELTINEGAAIGRILADSPSLQMEIANQVKAGEIKKIGEIETAAQVAKADEIEATGMGQRGFEGWEAPAEIPKTEVVTKEKAKLLSKAKEIVGKNRDLFTALVKKAEAAEAQGNILAKEANLTEKQKIDTLLQHIGERSIMPGRWADALKNYAIIYKRNPSPKTLEDLAHEYIKFISENEWKYPKLSEGGGGIAGPGIVEGSKTGPAGFFDFKDETGGILNPRVFAESAKQQAAYLVERFKRPAKVTEPGELVELHVNAPLYWPHLFPEKRGNFWTGFMRDARGLPQKVSVPSWVRKFRTGAEGFNVDPDVAARAVIRRIASYENDTKVFEEMMKYVVRDKGGEPVNYLTTWKKGDKVPDGYVAFWPEGRLKLYRGEIELGQKLAKNVKEEPGLLKGLYESIAEMFQDKEHFSRFMENMTAEAPEGMTTHAYLGATGRTKVYLLPKHVADRFSGHLKPHWFAPTYRNMVNLWKEGTLAGLFVGRWQFNNFTGNLLMSALDGSLGYVPRSMRMAISKDMQNLMPPEVSGGGLYGVYKNAHTWRDINVFGGANFADKAWKGLAKGRRWWVENGFEIQNIADNTFRNAGYLKRIMPYVRKEMVKRGYREGQLGAYVMDNLSDVGTAEFADVLKYIQETNPELTERIALDISRNIYDFQIKTPWEKTMSAYTHPFISWWKFQNAWVMSMAVNSPYKLAMMNGLGKIGHDILDTQWAVMGFDPNQLPPDIRYSIPVGPVDKDGKIPVLRIAGGNALYGVLDWKALITGISPAAKWILETGLHYDVYSGRELKTPYESYTGKVPQGYEDKNSAWYWQSRVWSLFTDVAPYGNVAEWGYKQARPYTEYETAPWQKPAPILRKGKPYEYPRGILPTLAKLLGLNFKELESSEIWKRIKAEMEAKKSVDKTLSDIEQFRKQERQ